MVHHTAADAHVGDESCGPTATVLLSGRSDDCRAGAHRGVGRSAAHDDLRRRCSHHVREAPAGGGADSIPHPRRPGHDEALPRAPSRETTARGRVAAGATPRCRRHDRVGRARESRDSSNGESCSCRCTIRGTSPCCSCRTTLRNLPCSCCTSWPSFCWSVAQAESRRSLGRRTAVHRRALDHAARRARNPDAGSRSPPGPATGTSWTAGWRHRSFVLLRAALVISVGTYVIYASARRLTARAPKTTPRCPGRGSNPHAPKGRRV